MLTKTESITNIRESDRWDYIYTYIYLRTVVVLWYGTRNENHRKSRLDETQIAIKRQTEYRAETNPKNMDYSLSIELERNNKTQQNKTFVSLLLIHFLFIFERRKNPMFAVIIPILLGFASVHRFADEVP